jgi:predicted alpha/beta superfamily hydrolase
MLAVAAASATVIATAQERVSSLTGEIRLHDSFASRILGNKRTLRVYLPPDYDKNRRARYPVLYMHDGQNCFDGMTSYIPNQEWRADEAAQALIENRMLRPLIIVAIDNAGADRANEYLPTKVKTTVKKYGEFVVGEVMPFINRTYRTKTGAKNTGLCGSSFGGVATLCIGLNYPAVFGSLGVISPSVWWDDRVLLKMVDALPKKTDQKIWVDIGTTEGGDSEGDAAALFDRLAAKGWTPGKNLIFYRDRFAKHNEAAWAGRMDLILQFLIGR